MCGIVGSISATLDQRIIESFGKSLDVMTHRGPDEGGLGQMTLLSLVVGDSV